MMNIYKTKTLYNSKINQTLLIIPQTIFLVIEVHTYITDHYSYFFLEGIKLYFPLQRKNYNNNIPNTNNHI